MPLVARSGGHSFAGYSVNDGLVIDLSRMGLASVDADSGLLRVGGGTRVGPIYDATAPFEIAIPTGTSPLVGVGGLVLGGGCAYASRALGLTLDALVETVLVTADGSVLTCNAHENADLFWACRGGGGGNFGINVSFVFQAQPVSDVTTFEASWSAKDAAAVAVAAQSVLQEGPDEFSLRLGISTQGSGGRQSGENIVVSLVGQMLGPASQLAPLLEPILSAATPRHQQVVERTYWEANKYLVHATSGDAFAMSSRYAEQAVPGEGIEVMVEQLRRWPGSSSPDGAGIGMFAWGGQINRVAPEATAFCHRNSLLLASIDTSWTAADEPTLIEENLRWVRQSLSRMTPYLSTQSYQNFPDPELTDWQGSYYGANYARLVEIKQAHDPDGVFTHPQGIGR